MARFLRELGQGRWPRGAGSVRPARAVDDPCRNTFPLGMRDDLHSTSVLALTCEKVFSDPRVSGTGSGGCEGLTFIRTGLGRDPEDPGIPNVVGLVHAGARPRRTSFRCHRPATGERLIELQRSLHRARPARGGPLHVMLLRRLHGLSGS
jgi:hypothetical protein